MNITIPSAAPHNFIKLFPGGKGMEYETFERNGNYAKNDVS